jgi:hypothetical protein
LIEKKGISRLSSRLDRRSFLGLASAFSATLTWPYSAFGGVPLDLPLPEAQPSAEKWIEHAVTLQPWGATEYKALTELPLLPRELKKEFGFNAIIVLPWEAHNALTDARLPLTNAETRLTEAQFRDGLSAYRKEGYKVILYSSVMHCGHAPVWQNGQLGREHPDWLQRDAVGQTIGAFGQAWLCPSSPARAYTLSYTLDLVRDYAADAIMLDNNGFGHTTKGFACYCEHCQRSFKEYVTARCGAAWIRRELQTDPEQLRIPTEKGPLLALWLCWRSRVWAETDELFRSSLRSLRPQIAFFVNIQYDQNPDPQAGRLQFSREDVVFSETHESDSWYISQKLVFGQALTQNHRPLWNYVANFRDNDPLRLRSPEEVSLMIATSLAHRTLPWINYPGLDSVEDQASRKEIARYVSWFAMHPDLFAGKLTAPVGTVVSLLTRDVFQSIKSCNRQGVTGCSATEDTPVLMSKHVGLLLRAGMPVIGLREIDLLEANLEGFRILTLPAARIFERRQAEVLAAWVRAGGTLIAAPDSGEYDELGRKLAHSVLWQALGLADTPGESQRVGSGRLLIPPREQFDAEVLASVEAAKLAFSVPQGTEVVVCEDKDRWLLHIVRHEPGNKAGQLALPAWLTTHAGACQWFSPEWTQPREIAFHGGMPLDIAGLPTYSIVALHR